MSVVPLTPHHRRARRSTAMFIALFSFGILASVATPEDVLAQQGDGPLSPELAAVKAALDKYKDPILAVHDGYLSTVGCLEFSKGEHSHDGMNYPSGGMGVHFLNPAFIGPNLDPMKPQVLLYEPVGDKLQLVAAEWFVPTAISKEAPVIFGQTLQGPMAGHEPLLPDALHHWDLHVWLWKSNPNGRFSPTNSSLKCPKTGYSIDEQPPRIVKP